MLRGELVAFKRTVLAVFGQVVRMRDSQKGLPIQDDNFREGVCTHPHTQRKRTSDAERGLQVAPGRSNKKSPPLAWEQRGSCCSVAYCIKT